ncbi:lactonase family protein [Endozoicomonas elysicola]|uniref:6-phosphogluconolactonase n=1 Tax=Endozoicomonas elysicola TaxID=305900 RepID=A0A081K630_9GAMM|nr:lactonase family protein [Endozoicomonas elysicola]KEI69606.1 hypothetical protein GV64_01585 [Endozoicomonas elysicola]
MSQLAIKIGCYTDQPSPSSGLQSMTMDLKTGAFSNLTTDLKITNPSFALFMDKGVYCISEASSDQDPKLVFIVSDICEKSIGLSEIPIFGGHPCHVAMSDDGGMVATSQYTGGSVDIFELYRDGSIKKQLKTIQLSGNSVHPVRQVTAHAHQATFLRLSCELVVVDLGSDKVLFFNYNKEHCFSDDPLHELNLPEGSGPRHLVFNQSETVAYIVCELSAKIIVIEKESGVWSITQEVFVLPNENGELPAAIKLSPDQRFLYVSYRTQAQIGCFKVDESSNSIQFLFSVSSEGDFPRDFSITACGKWLIAANQYTNNIVSFSRDPETGSLIYTGYQCRVGAPTCIGLRE